MKMLRYFSNIKITLLLIFCTDFSNSFIHDFNPWLLKSTKHRIPFDIDVSGQHQSPINIDSRGAKWFHGHALHFRNFQSIPSQLIATNTGHSLQVSGEWDQSKIPTVSSQGWDQPYKFVQLHFHWGKKNSLGSEHTIDHDSYPAELHVVFMKQHLDNFQNATKERNGIVVLGYLLDLSPKAHTKWMEPISKAIPLIRTASASVNITHLPLQAFMDPYCHEFYTYKGSLTTPPYSENVQWFIPLDDNKAISFSQLEEFRTLLDEDNNPISSNRRELQDLHGRKIYFSPQ